MGDNSLFSETEQRSAAYRICMLGTVAGGVASGLMVGRWVGVAGLLSGAAAGAVLGLVVGIKSCPRLAEPIKQKLFSQATLTHGEVNEAADALAEIAQLRSRVDALDLLALLRTLSTRLDARPPGLGLPPVYGANQLLRMRA